MQQQTQRYKSPRIHPEINSAIKRAIKKHGAETGWAPRSNQQHVPYLQNKAQHPTRPQGLTEAILELVFIFFPCSFVGKLFFPLNSSSLYKVLSLPHGEAERWGPRVLNPHPQAVTATFKTTWPIRSLLQQQHTSPWVVMGGLSTFPHAGEKPPKSGNTGIITSSSTLSPSCHEPPIPNPSNGRLKSTQPHPIFFFFLFK